MDHFIYLVFCHIAHLSCYAPLRQASQEVDLDMRPYEGPHQHLCCSTLSLNTQVMR